MRRTGIVAVIAALICTLSLGSTAFADTLTTTSAGASEPSVTIKDGSAAEYTLKIGDAVPGKEKRTITNDSELLQAALNTANRTSSDKVTVTLSKGATYTIDSKLNIYSHTDLNLNGATIKRSNAGVNDGIIYNYPIGWYSRNEGIQRDSVGGYGMSSDITVRNGSLDGGNINKATDSADLLRIDHASDITVSDVRFSNVYDCHHLEFVGVKNGLVSDCTFTGFRYKKGYEKKAEYGREAIELDGAWKGNDGAWAKDSKLDGTHNTDCVIENCTFTNVPTAAGSHHFSTGTGTYKENAQNVIIRNNTISAPNGQYLKTAITAGGIDNLTVTGNTVIGPYAFSIHAYRGNGIYIANNTFSGCNSNSIMVDGKAKNVRIDNNIVQNAKKHAISTLDCKVASITGNTITGAKSNGICVTSGSVKTITKNKVSGATVNSISVVGGTVGKIVENTLANAKKGHAITVSGSAKVTNIVKNAITSPKKNGISIAGKAKVTAIKGNTIIKKKDKFGIWLGSAQVKTKVQKNKITVQLSKYAIGQGPGVKAKLSGNKITVKK